MAPCSAGLSLGRLCDMAATATLTNYLDMLHRHGHGACVPLAVGEAVPDRASGPHAAQLAECKAMTHSWHMSSHSHIFCAPPSPTAPRQRTGCANTCCIQPMPCLSRIAAGYPGDSLDVPLRRSPLPLNQTTSYPVDPSISPSQKTHAMAGWHEENR
ncbi:hypothetical protein EDB80DRAFT_106073 [Ilyonectria destructans]|nr:hypothetical protein EDB80DRAFT_106073 [Ilyonectria destructans]